MYGKGLPFCDGLGDFLEFADGFVEQSHLAVSDAEVVVRLQIFVLVAHFAELAAEFLEDFGELVQAFGVGQGSFGLRLTDSRGR